MKLPDISLRDLHIYGGLALGAWSGAQLSVPWTGVVIAMVLVVCGVFAPRRKGS